MFSHLDKGENDLDKHDRAIFPHHVCLFIAFPALIIVFGWFKRNPGRRYMALGQFENVNVFSLFGSSETIFR